MNLSHSATESGWVSYPAELWNKEKPPPVGPYKFWLHCLERYGDPVLEVGCGNGRWAIPLAEHGEGHEVVGVDINEDLIATARGLVAEAAKIGREISASFHVGDIVHLDLGRQFPLVIMTSYTFNVLLSQEDQLAFLQRVREHLLGGGAFAFNLGTPFYRQRGLVDEDGVYAWPPRPDYHDGAHRTYDPVTQIETMRYRNGQVLKHRHTSLSELKLLLQLTGFEMVEIYGDDEDMRPFTGQADNDYTIIAERR